MQNAKPPSHCKLLIKLKQTRIRNFGTNIVCQKAKALFASCFQSLKLLCHSLHIGLSTSFPLLQHVQHPPLGAAWNSQWLPPSHHFVWQIDQILGIFVALRIYNIRLCAPQRSALLEGAAPRLLGAQTLVTSVEQHRRAGAGAGWAATEACERRRGAYQDFRGANLKILKPRLGSPHKFGRAWWGNPPQDPRI